MYVLQQDLLLKKVTEMQNGRKDNPRKTILLMDWSPKKKKHEL